MIERLLLAAARRLERRGSHMRIRRDGRPYMDRYFLLHLSGVGGLMLHRFWAGDPDCPHDHPYDSRSVLLVGEYVEQEFVPNCGATPRLRRMELVRAPDVSSRRPAEAVHRIVMPPTAEPGGTWSLLLYGRRRRAWGLHTPRGFERGEQGAPERGEELVGRVLPRFRAKEVTAWRAEK